MPTTSPTPFRCRPIPDWARFPADWLVHEVTAVATDSQDRVFVFNRGDHPVAVFDPDGTLLFSWGEGLFTRPHGITIGPDDAVYCTDDLGHTVRKFTPDGRLLLTLGTSGQPSDTGATSIDYRTIQRAGPPFHYPTNVALGSAGEIYVSDGYGNACVHKFAPSGMLLHSWGEPGAGPGQFHVPHGIAVDARGNVWVADRENSRLQKFSPEGDFLIEWTGIARPCDLAFDAAGRVYVAELGYRAGMWPGTEPPHPRICQETPDGSGVAGGERSSTPAVRGHASLDPSHPDDFQTKPCATGGRVSIFDTEGNVLARLGGGEHPTKPGDFFAPHDIWLDSRGSFYVAEVVRSAAKQRPPAGDYHTLQKFEPLPSPLADVQP
jgi:DNA-binding beta-propeller fold protein YncE